MISCLRIFGLCTWGCLIPPTKCSGDLQSSLIASSVAPACSSRHSLGFTLGFGGTFQNGNTRLPTSDRTFFAHFLNGCFRTSLLRPCNYVIVCVTLMTYMHRRNTYTYTPQQSRPMLSSLLLLQSSYCFSNRNHALASIDRASDTFP